MPSVEAAPAIATATRLAAGAANVAAPGAGGAFALVMARFVASLMNQATAETTAVDPTAAATAGATTDAVDPTAATTAKKKTTVAEETSTDALGALAVAAQPAALPFADASGLASPAGLGAQRATASATSATHAGIDAPGTGAAAAGSGLPGTAATAAATDAETTAAAAAQAVAAELAARDATTDAATDALADGALATELARRAAEIRAQRAATGTETTTDETATKAVAPSGKTTSDDLGLTRFVAERVATPDTGARTRAADTAPSLSAPSAADTAAVRVEERTAEGRAAADVSQRVAQARTDAHDEAASEPEPVDDTLPATQTTATDRLAAAHGSRNETATGLATATRTTADVSPAVASAAMAAFADTVARRAHQGTSRFSVRLDPAELGSVDVRVEVKANGEVKAHLVVERSDTLDMMLRDQKSLERSLAQAGLDVGQSGLQFSMRDGNGGNADRERTTPPTVVAVAEEEDTSQITRSVVAAAYRSGRIGGLDLRV